MWQTFIQEKEKQESKEKPSVWRKVSHSSENLKENQSLLANAELYKDPNDTSATIQNVPCINTDTLYLPSWFGLTYCPAFNEKVIISLYSQGTQLLNPPKLYVIQRSTTFRLPSPYLSILLLLTSSPTPIPLPQSWCQVKTADTHNDRADSIFHGH